jgi:hypothetical protein
MRPILPPLRLFLLSGVLIALTAFGSNAQESSTARAASVRKARTAPARHAITHQSVKRTVVAKASSAAAKRTATAARAAATTPGIVPGSAGLKAYIDPMNESDQGLVQQRLFDGSYMVDLQGRFKDYVILQLDPSGKRVFRCVRNARALQSAVPVPVAQPVER